MVSDRRATLENGSDGKGDGVLLDSAALVAAVSIRLLAPKKSESIPGCKAMATSATDASLDGDSRLRALALRDCRPRAERFCPNA